MCLLVVAFHVDSDAPVLVAANREERFDRASLPPRHHPGPPQFVAGTDQQAGGTWLGVNEHGLLVAVTNRPQPGPPAASRSRGLLCRDLLGCTSALEAADRALAEITGGHYAGANFVCLDRRHGAVVHGGLTPQRMQIQPGLHLMTNGDLDDPHDRRLHLARELLEPTPRRLEEFLVRTASVCAHPGIILRGAGRGTVSSDQVAVTSAAGQAIYRHAPGPPDRCAYDDHSALLRRLLVGVEAAEGPGEPRPPRLTRGRAG
jgi:transport and Golgi organization protein 2